MEFNSEQEVFDYIVSSLIKQGEPSIRTDPVSTERLCRYRSKSDTGDTLKCAAGFLIPDDVYNECMEGSVSFALPDKNQGLQHIKDYRDVVRALQRAHDENTTDVLIVNWLEYFKASALEICNKNSFKWNFAE